MKTKIGLILIVVISAGSLLAQSPTASIPFEQFGDHSFIKVKVNDSEELNFIFDTGDGLTVLNINKAKELGMASGHDATTISAEGSVSGKLVKHNEISVGGLPIHNVKIYETSLNHLEMSIGRDIDGIIGYDLLKNYVVTMNFDEMKIELYDSSGFTYQGNGTAMKINLTSYIPHIFGTATLSNGESLTGEFFVDTGAKANIDFNTPFVESNKMETKIGDGYVYLVSGLGKKEHEHQKGSVKSFSFVGFSFENVPVGLSHAKSGIQNHKKVAGILGSGVLNRFNITYNYGKKTMYWESNKNYDAPFKVNSSGIELQLSKDMSKVMIHKVFDDSPASGAGIAVNTTLESVDGKSAVEIGLPALREMLTKDGSSVSLVIDGKSIDLQLKALL